MLKDRFSGHSSHTRRPRSSSKPLWLRCDKVCLWIIASDGIIGPKKYQSRLESCLRLQRVGMSRMTWLGRSAVRCPLQNLNSNLMMPVEPFVSADEAGQFLKCSPVTVKRLAREGKIPAHFIKNGIRKRWRFLISELAISMKKELSSDRSSTPLSPRKEG